MNIIEDIIKGEVETLLIERGITIPLSLVMPDFSCQCEPDELGRLYVLNYNLPNPVRGIKGVVIFINSFDNCYRIGTEPIKFSDGGLGTRQHAVYNSIKRKITDCYRSELIKSGWLEDYDNNLNPVFIPPWQT